jgi:hypothetical protein
VVKGFLAIRAVCRAAPVVENFGKVAGQVATNPPHFGAFILVLQEINA